MISDFVAALFLLSKGVFLAQFLMLIYKDQGKNSLETSVFISQLQYPKTNLKATRGQIWRSNMYVTKKIINYQILILFISLNQYEIKFLFNQLLTPKKHLVSKK